MYKIILHKCMSRHRNCFSFRRQPDEYRVARPQRRFAQRLCFAPREKHFWGIKTNTIDIPSHQVNSTLEVDFFSPWLASMLVCQRALQPKPNAASNLQTLRWNAVDGPDRSRGSPPSKGSHRRNWRRFTDQLKLVLTLLEGLWPPLPIQPLELSAPPTRRPLSDVPLDWQEPHSCKLVQRGGRSAQLLHSGSQPHAPSLADEVSQIQSWSHQQSSSQSHQQTDGVQCLPV